MTCVGDKKLIIGTGLGILCVQWWTVEFHKLQENSWLAKELLASQEGHCFMELVS